MSKLALLALALVLVPVSVYGQVIMEKPQRGSEEISEYYNPEDVRLAMIGIAIAVIILFLYLARDIILRRKSDYEKKEFDSKKNRDYEKYHSEWNRDDEDYFGERKSKEAQEFRKMMQDSALPNYYRVLGVSMEATQEEIKAKFRQLAKEYHPDKSKDEKSAELFAEINKAYEVLSDEETRKDYDKYYKASFG
ncbi:DnaJ domain-containing protein [Candidatus Nitrosotenuis aquarius]|uniref:DnaJ domain-containing protein n=1 Tax=Candidatus Nitrosotenuis aquarius TaxID=1846278 RepID=UPI000C1E829D|nr:DnaJ domain-containing protein [Candidatus Nitrosotenuis aquarius]